MPLFSLLTLVLLFGGVLFYTEEKETFDSILRASWFVLVTMSTVGYGDIYPTTALGYIITSVAIICGVLFMAMPITIVGNNFAAVWEEKEAIKVVLKMQELLLLRDMRATDVLLVFAEFDDSGDGTPPPPDLPLVALSRRHCQQSSLDR